MRRALLVTALAACHGAARHADPAPVIAAVAGSCDPERIGAVIVDGATRDALAPLTVLEGTLDDPERTDRVAQLALEGVRADGHAKATLEVTRASGCGVELHARVVLGPRFRIASITFDSDGDGDELPAAQRLAVIEDGLGTVNTVGGTYIAYRMKRALKELDRRYADAGYLAAKIEKPHADYDAGRGTVAITIPVHPGARFTIGSVRAIGAGADARARVLDALGLREGAYYDRETLRIGIERAQRVLDRKIQLRTEIAPERREIDVDAIVEAAQ